MLLRIDADFIAYRAAQAAEVECNYSDLLTTIQSDTRQAIRNFESDLKAIKKKLRSNQVELYFTSPNNFRKTVDPAYKGNRIKRKPCGYKTLLAYCKDKYPFHEIDGLEADDVLGIHCHNSKGKFILVSPDKDFKQIACRQYDPLKHEERTVTTKAADAFFYRQVLTGDPTDGYSGLKGIGEVKASAILNKGKADLWAAVVRAYEAAGQTEADAIHQARLARILRPEDFDQTTQQPILWTPPAEASRVERGEVAT